MQSVNEMLRRLSYGGAVVLARNDLSTEQKWDALSPEDRAVVNDVMAVVLDKGRRLAAALADQRPVGTDQVVHRPE